jgi:FtsZ-binding cell division protein ZapB
MADFNKYYRAYLFMQEALKGDFTHNYITANLSDADLGKDELSGKTYSRVIDMDWVEAIEDAIPYIDKAIREQRRFIIQNEDIVPIEKARKITNESVRHLAQHTNMIARVEGDDVTPERILDIQREESFAIYENRFLRTLLLNVARFVDERYKEMKNAPNDSYHKVHISRSIQIDQSKLDFELSYANETHETNEFDITADVSTLTDFQRVLRLRRVFGDFCAAPLIRDLSTAELVRPPIQRTNLMTKNPNFKKALDLWLFIESYTKTGFEVVGNEYSGTMDKNVQEVLYNVMSYEHFVVTMATNPALKKKLHEKYLEDREKQQSLLSRSEQLLADAEARIDKVREEETKIRLEEIRAREKVIAALNSELKHAKLTLHQYEVKMTEMKGLINLHENTIQKLKDEIFELEKEKKVLIEKLEELVALAKEQKALIEKQSEEIASLKSTIEAKDAEIIKHLEAISVAEKVIESCKAEIAELKATNEQLQNEVADNQKLIADLQSEVETLRDTVYKNAEEIGLLKNTLAEREADINIKTIVIADLNNKVDSLENEIADQDAKYKQETAELKRTYDSEKKAMQDDYAAKENELKESCQAEIESIHTDCEAQISTLKASYESTALKEEERHRSEIEAVQRVCDMRIRQQKEDAEKETERCIMLEQKRHKEELKKVSKEYEKSAEQIRRNAKREAAVAIKAAEAKAEEKIANEVGAMRAKYANNKSNAKLAAKIFDDFLPGCFGFAAAGGDGYTLVTYSNSKRGTKKYDLPLLNAVISTLNDREVGVALADKSFALVNCEGVSASIKMALQVTLKEDFGFENPIIIDSKPTKKQTEQGKVSVYFIKR